MSLSIISTMKYRLLSILKKVNMAHFVKFSKLRQSNDKCVQFSCLIFSDVEGTYRVFILLGPLEIFGEPTV